jgi:hypothetical protein
MIVSVIKGGIGNQLFQISTGYALALRSNTEFAINYSIPFTLGQVDHPVTYKNSLFKKIRSTSYISSNKYIEPHFHYKNIESNDILLDGYFQSQLYFDDYKYQIKSLYSFSDDIKSKFDTFLNQYDNTVGIHFRLGDYKQSNGFHPLQSKQYILNAIDIIGRDKT